MKLAELKNPEDEWKCFMCLQEKPDMDVFAEDDSRIYLICEPCRNEIVRNLMENEADF